MKKGILLIATAAALVLGSNNASADSPNVPTWYNFQGVCLEQNATVNVQFDIVNAKGTTIYSEVHSGVMTNPSGIFTCHVGEGEPLEGQGGMPSASELYNGDLTLVTYVNGTEVSHAAFGAVPYATMAASIGEFTAEDLGNLTGWIEEIEANVNTNIEGIANAEQSILELTPIVKGNTAAIAKLLDDNEININGIANAEQTLIELTPAVAGNTGAIAKLQEDVEININGIANAEQSILELTEANMEHSAAIANIKANYVSNEDLDASMKNFQENIEYALKAYVTIEDLDASMNNFMENIDYVYVSKETYAELEDAVFEISSDVQGIQESLRGKASVEKVAEIDDILFEVSNDLQGVQESLRDYVNYQVFNSKVDELQRALDKLASQLK